MNLPELFKWLAENEWELQYYPPSRGKRGRRWPASIGIKDGGSAQICWLNNEQDVYGPFLAAAPEILAELAVDKIKERIGNKFAFASQPLGYYEATCQVLEDFAIPESHYRAVIQKLEKVKERGR